MPGENPKRRRRRNKVARTEDFSSDSSDDSDSSSDNNEQSMAEENNDEQMDIDIDINPEQQHSKIQTAEPHPKLTIPDELKHDNNNTDNSFQDYYVQLMTSEFAEDLDKLRQSNDFNEKSLYMLIQSLKEGSKMYTKEEAEIIHNSSKN